MWKVLPALLLLASPALAQPAPKSVAARTDPCAAIGRTADGKLVYSMKCENIPASPVPPPPPQAEVREAPPAAEPEPEVRRSGIFGWSYDRR
ncbi:hypothetical protein JQ596_12350 [Bradyrhizobium manausense]|uniref:hypothetical protein n=1 Tax=Bradyrhizobium TaxID=374 RepID=UPI001BA491B8|nr:MULTISPECIES: hypothetical protein [Bradyrhizobium]MBR0826332.1 hypothetical protein [Bradyrhizobium manausense]UVO31662.1 hypothetical protein KUF59_14085 [Bradyrhizobium arachidis]